MARFRFKLDPVVQLRQSRDDDAQRALAQAERHLRAAEHRCLESERRLAEAYAAATEAERNDTDMARLFWHRNWIAGKTRDVDAHRLEVQQRQDVRDVTAREAREARVALRVLERLRDRAREAFDARQAREEALAIDELATLRAARRSGDIV